MKFLNNWRRELASGLSASETTAELTAAAGFALVEGETVTLTLQGEVGGVEQLEIVRVTDVDGTTLTLQRGQEGTAPVIWPAGSIIEHRATAAQLQQLQTWARAVPEDAPAEEPQRPHMRVPGGWVPYEEPDSELPGWTASADAGVAVLAAEEGRDAIILPSVYRALRLDTEGDERGQRAVDMQRERIQPSEVASGFDALLGPGRNCSASGWGSAVLGSEDSHCTGSWSFIAGCARGAIGAGAWQGAVIASRDSGIAENARNTLIAASYGSSASGQNTVVIGATDSVATGDRSVVIGSTGSTAQPGSTVVGGMNNTASDFGAVVLGGSNNNASGYQSAAIAGNDSQATGAGAIAGGNYATASGSNALALGGSSCQAEGMNSVALGGASNTASDFGAAVLGGAGNNAGYAMAAVIGGSGNTANEQSAVVIGGSGGQASGSSSAVIGGGGNQASGSLSAVLAGSGNTASGELSAVLGGNNNNCAGDLSAAFAADSCVVDAELASASGSGALSHGRPGSHTRAGVQQWPGRGPGAAQSVDLVLSAQTEDDTPAVLALAHGAPGIPMPGTAAVVATVIARTAADAAAWQIKCLVHDGGLIGTAVIDQIAASAGASGWAVDAAMATGALEITVTGPEAATCTWVADVRLTESV